MKQIVQWEPKRVEKGQKNGQPEYVGKLRTKVKEGTPNAVHHTGANEAGVKWDYYGVDVDSINGVVRWVDVRDTDFGWQLVLFLETEKRLNQLSVPYDINNVRRVMNHLCGLKKELSTAFINISYWVRKKTDGKGNVKTDEKGKTLWAKDLYFTDVPELFTFEQWKDFAEKNGLEWFQEVRNGKKEWNYTAELNFWLSKVVGVQRYLLTTDNCLPFTWNSVTACEAPSPGGNLTSEEIATAKSIYESIKPLYKSAWSRDIVTGDDVSLDPEPGYVAGPAIAPPPGRVAPAMIVDDFPEEVHNYENNAPNPGEDLPF